MSSEHRLRNMRYVMYLDVVSSMTLFEGFLEFLPGIVAVLPGRYMELCPSVHVNFSCARGDVQEIAQRLCLAFSQRVRFFLPCVEQ